METYITCIRCKNKKLPTEFGINRAIRDGRNRYCKPCCAEKRRKFRDKSGPRYLQRNLDKEVVLVVKSCEICDEKFNPISSRHRRCDSCSHVARDIVHHALVGGTKRSNKNWDNAASAAAIVQITKRYIAAKECCYCAQPFTDTRPKSLDHIRPVCLGGENESGNINISCRDCNQSKAHHKLEEWIDLCKRVVQNAGFEVNSGNPSRDHSEVLGHVRDRHSAWLHRQHNGNGDLIHQEGHSGVSGEQSALV